MAPLSLWNDGPAKSAILEAVARATLEGGPDYRAPSHRVAVFDDDGVLWPEHPLPVQALFALDHFAYRRAELARRPIHAALAPGDLARLAAFGKGELVETLLADHAGQGVTGFSAKIGDWLETARHPELAGRWTDLSYAPMRQLLTFLSERAFSIFLVCGGGFDFVRVVADRLYGLAFTQVVGPIRTRVQVETYAEFEAKPLRIVRHIGRPPILAFGNGDGDLPMLQVTEAAGGACFLLHHDDAEREYAYDRGALVGHLDRALDEARARDWPVISMRDDWNLMFDRVEEHGDRRARPDRRGRPSLG